MTTADGHWHAFEENPAMDAIRRMIGLVLPDNNQEGEQDNGRQDEE